MAAFFGRVGRKNIQRMGGFQNQQDVVQVIYSRPTGNVINKLKITTAPQ